MPMLSSQLPRRRKQMSLCSALAGIAVTTAMLVFPSIGSAELNPNNVLKYPCYVGNPHYNTKLCGETREQAENLCGQRITNVTQGTLLTSGRYVDNSQSQYRVAFRAVTAGGCWPGGTEHITVVQQLQNGASGVFTQNGPTTLVDTSKIEHTARLYPVQAILDAPYDCATLMPDSAVRPVVTVEWIPKPGWSHAKALSTIVPGPSTPIC
jgi:hypothetical protein